MISLILITGIVFIDQITKIIVSNFMSLDQHTTFIPYFIRLHYVRNDGAAFGILSNARWVFIVISIIALAAMIFILIKTTEKHILFTISLSFFIGGGIGNMIDRLVYGEVVDFFEFTFVKFAIFNVADIFITFGAIIFGVYMIFFDNIFNSGNKKETDNEC